MSEKKALTQKQKYLEYILPGLNDSQVDRMIAVARIAHGSKGAAASENTCNFDPYTELMGMIGCDNAKKQLTAMIADFRMRKISAARGRKISKAYYHAVFTGNPGCAKTTVARLYAKALAKEGVTENNKFEEISRAGLIGQYVGSTAAKVREVFRRNKGGVIFIDEAYALCDGDRRSNNNYGEEAINEIIVCLENQPETVVIFAGYPDRMDEFLADNPGLRSRIPYHVEFSDYTTDELIEISKVIAREKGFELTASAVKKLTSVYDIAKQDRDFGNGRYVRNMIEAAVRTKGISLGVMASQNLDEYSDSTLYSDETLFTLDESCIIRISETAKPARRAIGFCP